MIKKVPILIISTVLIYLVGAILSLLVLPQPLGPFEYIVAGCFSTAVCLLFVFTFHARSTFGRTARRSERSS